MEIIDQPVLQSILCLSGWDVGFDKSVALPPPSKTRFFEIADWMRHLEQRQEGFTTGNKKGG
jgi:hypothetical protein